MMQRKFCAKPVKNQCKSEEKLEDYIALSFLLIVYIIFNLFLVNRFFPITEGWFQDAANYMNQGKQLYEDFYMFIPPGFPMLTAWISKITNNTFLYFRLFGIAERVLMLGVVYWIFRRLFSPAICAVSCLTGGIMYIANVQETFYGYYQTSLFLGVVAVYFCLRMYECFDKPYMYGYAIGFGVCTALSFFFKQTQGLLLSFAIGTMFFASVCRVDLKKSLKCLGTGCVSCLTVFVAASVIMLVTGTFQPFLAQVFGGTSSKGSLLSILFGFWSRIVIRNSVLLSMLFLCFYILHHIKANGKQRIILYCSIGQWVILGLTMALFAHYMYRAICYRDTNYPISALYGLIVLFGLLVLAFGSLLIGLDKVTFKRRFTAVGLLLGGFLVLFFSISSFEQSLWDFNIVRNFRQHVIYAVFITELVISVFLLYRVLIHREQAFTPYLIICVASWSLMYIHGFSFIIEDHSALLSITLFVGFLLSAPISFRPVKQFIVYFIACVFVVTVFYQRNWYTYYWWGVNQTNTTYAATETFDDPHLKGIYANIETTDPMNEIYGLVEKYKRDDSTMYVFPHMNYFNVMSELPSPTFAKVHYFDVCPDFQAEQDAALLLSNRPDFIIWMEMSEATWVTHEEIFRAGAASGQRAIQNAYTELIHSGEYTLLGTYVIYNSDPIYLWIKTGLM